MPDDSYWNDAYYKEMLNQRLQEIDKEIEGIKPQIKKLHEKATNLHNERWEIITRICEHSFEETGYGKFRDEIWKSEMICVKCGLTKWEVM